MVERVICFQKNHLGIVQFATSPRLTFQGAAGVVLPLTPKGAGLSGARHGDFDWAVGDRGRLCTLWELDLLAQGDTLVVPWGDGGSQEPWTWFPFGDLTARLTNREDRRYLLLAVQYISAGGVPQDALAASADEELIKSLKKGIAPSQGP